MVLLGDRIQLESVVRRGYFLCAKPTGAVQLSATDVTQFTLAVPQLKHLVALKRGGESGPFNGLLGPRSPTAKRREPLLSEAEAEWLRLLAKLPLELVYRILMFRGKWVRDARLVCREWHDAANQHVHRIRVNGEFACIGTPEERAVLLAFIARCRHLTRINLRNVDDLADEDMRVLFDCRYLRHLSLGGCRSVRDESLRGLERLAHLVDLNLAATRVSDRGLEAIAAALPRLTSLNLYACQHVTAHGVQRVLSALDRLDSLNVRGCNVDKATLDALQRAFPGCAILAGPLSDDGIYS